MKCCFYASINDLRTLILYTLPDWETGAISVEIHQLSAAFDSHASLIGLISGVNHASGQQIDTEDMCKGVACIATTLETDASVIIRHLLRAEEENKSGATLTNQI